MEELLGRQAPHSATAEQAVIGSMLIDTRCIPDVIERLRGAEFYVKQNRDIFETIYAMFSYGQTIDPVTVLDQMKVRGVYTDASTEYIAELMRITPTAANVLEYATIVRDRALLRNLATAADEINNLVYEGSRKTSSKRQRAKYTLSVRAAISAVCFRYRPLFRTFMRVYPRPHPAEKPSPDFPRGSRILTNSS